MRTKATAPTYEEAIDHLRRNQFDVRELSDVAGQILVSKYGAGAILVRNPSRNVRKARNQPEIWYPVLWITHPGWLLNGKVSTVLDRGYQKFFTTPELTVAATADALKAKHRFAEELREIIGEPTLYNESLGSVSDSYLYDRVKGRDVPEAERATPAWDLPGRR